MSSGAMMAERVGVEISDLVAAIIPASGQIVGQSSLPITLPGPPVAPVSVQEWQGTNDGVLPPCNNGKTLYSGYTFYMATVDQTFNYWTAQNACTVFQNNEPLCENGKANPSTTGNDATGCTNNVEVQFIWEEKLGHGWDPANNGARWQFFASHPKQ
jgi:poly(3-hydroxybutyrate) depolymerase